MISRITRNLATAVIVAGFVAIAVSFLPALHGDDIKRPSPGRLIVHEWGTFTSFAGSDGVNLEFRPLVANDLPPFVLGPFSQPGPGGIRLDSKALYYAVQRMETPVTYFYTDVPRTVNVRVDFPKGMLTEWFPAVEQFDAGRENKESKRPMGDAFLDWGAVRLIPPKSFSDVRVHGANGEAAPAQLLPVDDNNHYGRARETDSAIVETIDARRGSYFEKFLFYRGLGNFELPLKLLALGNDRYQVINSSDDASGALLLVHIENDRVRFTRLDPIRSHAATEVKLPIATSTVDQLAEATVGELTAAGLYEKEALAMVNTWRTSWFGESGTRLLYLVPQKLTDNLLPLEVVPTPDERVRILVGRLETLTPEDCQRLTRALTGSDAGEMPAPESITAELASLGRFAEPALQFVISQSSDLPTRSRLETILADLRAPAKNVWAQ